MSVLTQVFLTEMLFENLGVDYGGGAGRVQKKTGWSQSAVIGTQVGCSFFQAIGFDAPTAVALTSQLQAGWSTLCKAALQGDYRMSFPTNIGSARKYGPMPAPAMPFNAGNSVAGPQMVSRFIAYQIGMWNDNGSLGPGNPVNMQTLIGAYQGCYGMDADTALTAATQFYTWEAQGSSQLGSTGNGGLWLGGQGSGVAQNLSPSLGAGNGGGTVVAVPAPFNYRPGPGALRW